MKILVCIAKVPDTTSKISFVDNNTKFNEDKIQFIINPYDEWYALVRALELKETLGGEVHIINVGLADSETIIRKALALGADEAYRINANPTDGMQVAQYIADFAKDKNYDAIACGKETIDFHGSMVGPMIATALNLPFVSLATQWQMQGTEATIDREIEGGKETIKVQTPFVLSATKGMAEQRIAGMRGIMASRTKVIHEINPSEFSTTTQLHQFELPPSKQACKMISPENVEELVNLLHTEAKVI